MENNKDCNTKRFYLGYAAVFLGIIASISLFLIEEIFHVDTVTGIILVVLGIVLIIISVGRACVLELSYGSFECPDCGEKFTPSMKEYIFAPHTPTRRYLRCPGCGDKKMCKYKLNK